MTLPSPNYLIITSSGLASSFQPLADWKTRKGVPARIISIETIQSSYSGADLAAKIKNCIYEYVFYHGVEFVLLGGDESIIPVYYCYCIVNGEDPPNDPNWTLPADIYYSGLEGIDITNWNSDGDGEPCEPSGDGVDMYPDVIITRAAVRTPAHARAFAEKSINYEANPPLSDFAKKLIVSGVLLWDPVGEISDAEAKSDILISDFIAPYWSPTIVRLFDTTPGIDLSAALLKAYMDLGFGHMHIATHGGNTSWSVESGSSYNSGDAAGQTNFSTQGVIATIACNSNGFDQEDDPCLSEALIRNSHGGAVGFFGSSRYGWGYGGGTAEHGASFLYDDEFYRRLLSDGVYQFGRLSTETKISRMPAAVDYGATRWLQFTINPQGDPELGVLTEDPVFITATHEATIDAGSNFIVTTSPSGKKVCCWMESADYYQIGISPFTFTAPSEEGTILVTASARNSVPYLGSITVENLFAPRGIVLVAPFDDAAIGQGANSLRPTLLWEVPGDPNDDNIHFRVQWDDAPDFDSPLGTAESRLHAPGFFGGPYPVLSGTSDTIGYTFAANLVHGATYWWRVSAFDGLHYGNWSETRSFTVDTTLDYIDWSQRVSGQFAKSPSRAGVAIDLDRLSAIEFPTEADQIGAPIIDPGLETLSNWEYFANRLTGTFDYGQSSERAFQGTYSYKFGVGSSILMAGDYQQISQAFDMTDYNALFFALYADGENNNDRVRARVYIAEDLLFDEQIVSTPIDEASAKIDISSYRGENELVLQQFVRTFSLATRRDCYFDNIRLGWTVFSSPIRFDDAHRAMEWNRVKWTESGANGDFRLTVQRVEEGVWTDIDGLVDLDHSAEGHDISMLGHQDSIRLKGKFTYSGGAPAVEDWSVSWTYDPTEATEAKLPQTLAISIFPNPFNSSCKIVAPEGSKVRIYDIQGRIVEDLSESFAAPRNTEVWSPSNEIGSGVYFVRIEHGKASKVLRAVLVK